MDLFVRLLPGFDQDAHTMHILHLFIAFGHCLQSHCVLYILRLSFSPLEIPSHYLPLLLSSFSQHSAGPSSSNILLSFSNVAGLQAMSSSTQNGPVPSGTSLKLTGGIEIECLLLTYYSGGGPESYSAECVYEAQLKIHAALSAPMRLICVDCKNRFDHYLLLHKPRDPHADIDDDEDDYTKWNIDTDPTLELSPAECSEINSDLAYDIAPIEIKSRVIPLTEKFDARSSRSTPGHIHKITYHDEIGAVYSRLHQSFNNPRGESATTSRLVVNRTASTHVHIGSSYHGFPLDTVKNVTSVVVAHEMAIDTIHATDRISGSDRLSRTRCWDTKSVFHWDNDLPKAYNVPWSTQMSVSAYLHYRGASMAQRQQNQSNSTQPPLIYPAKEFRQNPALKLAAQKCDVVSWLTLIEGARSIQDLKRFHFGSSHNCTVNIDNLKEQRPLAADRYSRWDGKMTIEFRQHGATLQANETLNWIGVLVALLKYATTTSPAEVQAACLKNWNDPNFDMLDLLKILGFHSSDDIFRHYARVLGVVSQRRPYAEIIEDQELLAARSFGPNDPFADVTKLIIKNRAENLHPNTVRDRVSQKLTLGGYGQFSESYLSQCALGGFIAPEYLKLGFCPPWSEYVP